MSWYLIKDGKQGEQENKASIGVVKRAMQCTSDKNPTTIRLRGSMYIGEEVVSVIKSQGSNLLSCQGNIGTLIGKQ